MGTFHIQGSVVLAGICGIALLTGCAKDQSVPVAKAAASAGVKEAAIRNNIAAEPVKPAASTSQLASTRVVTIPEGSLVRVRTQTSISTREARNGETIQANLDAPVQRRQQLKAHQDLLGSSRHSSPRVC